MLSGPSRPDFEKKFIAPPIVQGQQLIRDLPERGYQELGLSDC
jgi:hypothetical protein